MQKDYMSYICCCISCKYFCRCRVVFLIAYNSALFLYFFLGPSLLENEVCYKLFSYDIFKCGHYASALRSICCAFFHYVLIECMSAVMSKMLKSREHWPFLTKGGQHFAFAPNSKATVYELNNFSFLRALQLPS